MIPDGPCGFAIPDEASLLLLSTGEVVARVQNRRVDPGYCVATLNRDPCLLCGIHVFT